jgi:hypothetical protein
VNRNITFQSKCCPIDILIFDVLKNLQGNKVGTVLTDVNKRKMVFVAKDSKDNGYNGTDGMSYTVIGEGKFLI